MRSKSFVAVLALVALISLAAFAGSHAAPLTPFSDLFAGGVSGTMTRNQIPKVAGASKISDSSISDDGTTVSVSEPIAAAGKVTITRDPASTANTNASLVVNPATSASNELFLGLLDNSTTVFSVDKEGDVVILGGITLNTDKFTVAAASGNTVVGGTLTAAGGVSTLSGGVVTGSTINTSTGATLSTASSGFLLVASASADNDTIFILPAASTKARYCGVADAVTGSNRELKFQTPTGSDLIIGTTNPAGATGIATTAGASHGIKNTHATAVRGNSVCLQADGTNTWYMTSLSGTWAAY